MKKTIKNILPDVEKIIALIIITFFLTIFTACRKSPDIYYKEAFQINIVSSIISGRVTDLNDFPVSDAIITDGINTTTTDNNGTFTIKKAHLNKEFGFVKASKAGYFPGSRTFLVNSNLAGNIKIILLPKIVSGKFSAASGGIVNICGNGSVSFSANSIVNAVTGIAYSGNVSVSTFYLDPTDARCNDYMPGDLLGIDVNNRPKILKSFGMAAIELNDEAGEKLQLAPGKTATITFPITSSLQADASPNIPLWYFNETNGLWNEEGMATRQGNSYKGTVTHFSFWNCDLPANYVKLELALSGQKSIPLADKLVTITSATYGTRIGYTDSNGMISGLVPANEILNIKVYDQCGEVIYTNNIGPFNTDTNFGNITVGIINDPASITLSGEVINCDNAAVTNGFVQVYNGIRYYYAPVNKGSFVITFPYCSNSSSAPTIVAYDIGDSWQSSVQTINITNGTQNIGQLHTCFTLILS
jgi:hypothetical protein